MMRMIRKMMGLFFCYSTIFILLHVTGINSGIPSSAVLVYKRAEKYAITLFTRADSNKQSASFWRPMDSEKRFYPLGDVHNPGDKPPGSGKYAIMVQDNDDGLVAPPASTTLLIGNAALDGAFFALNPPKGYTCMGIVAIWNFKGASPDKDQFRCLKSHLVVPGDSTKFFNYGQMSLWNVIPKSLKFGAGLATGSVVYSNSPTVKPSEINVVNSIMAIEAPPRRLVYKKTKAYTLAWRYTVKYGSVRFDFFSFWRPVDFFNRGFYGLGDIIMGGKNYPVQKNVMMVQDNDDGLVAPPVSYTELVRSKKMGGTLLKMNPPDGYTCMGIVVIWNYDGNGPDKNQFRCLRSDLVTSGNAYFLTSFKDMNEFTGYSLWDIVVDDLSTELVLGTDLMTFYPSSRGLPPATERPVVRALKAADGIDPNHQVEAKKESVRLVLYETSDVDLIWNDGGSGGTHDVSIWRAKECCSLGDTAVGNYDQFAAYWVKDVSPNSDALRKPNDFKFIYNNEPSKAEDVSFWRPDCPQDYVALGYVANRGYNKPSIDATNFRCVHKSIVTLGTWNWVWNGVNSGARQVVSVYRADPATIRGDGVGVWAMSAIAMYGEMDKQPHVLKAANVLLQFQKPIRSIKITNVVYDWANKITISQGPSDLSAGALSYVDNCVGDSEVKTGRKVGYSKTLEKSWAWDLSVQVGIAVEFTAKIPLIGESKTTASVSVSTSYSNTVTESRTVSDEFSSEVPTAAGYKDGYYITGTTYVTNLPFTAYFNTTYTDGSYSTGMTTGVYADQSISEMTFTRQKPEFCGPTTTVPPTTKKVKTIKSG